MAANYSALSGTQMVKQIRGKNVRRLLLNSLGIVLAVGMLFFAFYEFRGGHWFYGIMGLAVGIIIFWLFVQNISAACATLKNVAECRVFRKYGSPDELAQRISEGSLSRLLESNKALVTDSFIMKHKDYETYVPFQSVLLLYRKEHRTNGVLDGIYLVVHDAYGDSFDYPFKLGSKHEDEMQLAANAIAQSAPNCRLGYTKENLDYVNQNARKI